MAVFYASFLFRSSSGPGTSGVGYKYMTSNLAAKPLNGYMADPPAAAATMLLLERPGHAKPEAAESDLGLVPVTYRRAQIHGRIVPRAAAQDAFPAAP